MEIKNEKELIEWVYDMHLQNLSGREDFVDAFKQGIEATIDELKELKFLNLPFVINRSYSIEALEVMFLAGFTEGRMNCPVCGHKPEDWKLLFEKHYKWTFKND